MVHLWIHLDWYCHYDLLLDQERHLSVHAFVLLSLFNHDLARQTQPTSDTRFIDGGSESPFLTLQHCEFAVVWVCHLPHEFTFLVERWIHRKDLAGRGLGHSCARWHCCARVCHHGNFPGHYSVLAEQDLSGTLPTATLLGAQTGPKRDISGTPPTLLTKSEHFMSEVRWVRHVRHF